MNGHATEKKVVNNNWESEDYSGVEKNPTIVKQNYEVFCDASDIIK
jgi:hypothetical protein